MAVIGQVDEISRAYVVGWAVDTDHPRRHLPIRIVVDGREAGQCRADIVRARLAVQAAADAGDDHGFRFDFDPPLTVYQPAHISVEVVGHAGPKLKHASRTLPAPEPLGMLSPLIVTSTGRSGTTLLMSEFARHPGIVVAERHPFEIKLVAYYASAFRALNANEDREHSTHPDRMFVDDDRYRIGHNPYNTPGSYGLARDPDALADLFEIVIPDRFADLFRRNILDFYAILQRSQGKRQATLFAEKGDLNPAARAGCRMFFGRVREVVLVRDPRDLLCSAKAFWHMDSATALAMLATTLPQLADIAAEAGPDTLVLRYEDILSQPEQVRSRLFGFLGLDKLDILAQPERSDAGGHGTTASPLSSMARWQADLTVEEQAACAERFAGYAETFGYALGPAARAKAVRLHFTAERTIGPGMAQGGPVIDIPVSPAAMAGLLLDGWSAVEGDHVWSCKRQAVLRLRLPPSATAATVAAEVMPFTLPGQLPLQRVRVTVDGRPIGEALVRTRGVVEFELEADAAATERIVQFDLPDAGRPSQYDPLKSDDRLLGLDLRHIAITGVRPPAEAAAGDGASLSGLMGGFESLGENCEFGLVQRRCGVEPQGLLGFGSAPLPKLLNALRARFAGVGAAENTRVALSASGSEYMVYDRQFGLNYHTWVVHDAMPEEVVRARELDRLPSLLGSLLADLDAGGKIFVFRSVQAAGPDDAAALAAEVQSYGPGTVLWVEADPAQRRPAVAWAGPGLMRGVMRRLAPPDDAGDFLLGDWITLCREAAALRGARNG